MAEDRNVQTQGKPDIVLEQVAVLRHRIDDLDEEIIRLLNARATDANKIGLLKDKNRDGDLPAEPRDRGAQSRTAWSTADHSMPARLRDYLNESLTSRGGWNGSPTVETE